MESSSQLLTTQATTTMDFLDQLKDFLTHTLHDLQLQGAFPPIVGQKSKKGTPRQRKDVPDKLSHAQVEWSEVHWEFDVKDPGLTQKFGNFSSPTLIKLTSRYNKQAQQNAAPKGEAAKIAEILCQELNLRLEDESLVQT